MRRRICALLLLMLFAVPPCRGEEINRDRLLTYYDGCMFVGDSITRQLEIYVYRQRAEHPGLMKKAIFAQAQSYFLADAPKYHTQAGGHNLTYRGMELSLYEILAEAQPPRALILLGVNDYIGEKIEKGLGYCEKIIERAAEASPDTQVIFQSLTPVTPAFCRGRDYRTMWDEYNAALERLCAEKGVGYIDIASRLKDEEGYLRAEYSSDGEYHLNAAGIDLWLDALADYAKAQYDLGLWAPEE